MINFASVAKAAKQPEDLKGFGEFVQDEATYPNGTHICEVEIDPDTGGTTIHKYTVVDDFGATVNPTLLAGQVHGGIVQGLGQALTEDTVYGDDGQLMTASFMDYAVPRALESPFIHFETRNVPSTTNAMGIKGAGEAGTIGSTPAGCSARSPTRSIAPMASATSRCRPRPRGSGRRSAPQRPNERTQASRPANALTGIAFKVASVRCSSPCRPASSSRANCRGEVVFFRSAFAVPPIVLFMAWRGDLLRAFHTSRPLNHVARGMVGVASMGLGFFGLARLPLPESITLNYAQPLMVIVSPPSSCARPSAPIAGAPWSSGSSACSSSPGRS